MDNTPDEIFGKENNFIKEIQEKKQEINSKPPPPKGNKGIMHNHTIYSIYDGAQTPLELVKAAKAAGYKNVCLSDHGTLMALAPFLSACKEEGMNGVVGVELYLTDEKYPEIKRGHLCLYAVDNEGLKSIINVLAKSFEQYEKTGMTTKKVYPITSLKILQEIKKGHVFATTACVNSAVAQTLCGNKSFLKEYNKYSAQLEEFDIDTIKSIITEVNDLEEQKEEIKTEIESLNTTSITPLREKLKTIPKENKELIQKGKDYIKKVQEDNKKIQAEKKELKLSLEPINAQLKEKKPERTLALKQFRKYEELIEKRNAVPFVPEKERKPRTDKFIKDLINIFGKRNLFIELQYHGLDIEKEYYPKVLEIAKENNLKTVVANDAHFDIKGKDYKRWLLSTSGLITYYNMVSTPDDTDTEYYIKTEEELIEAVSQIIPKKEVEEAVKNTYNVLEKCHVEIDNSLHFPQFSETAEDDLRKLTYEGAVKRYGNLTNEIKARIEYELNIINTMGFASYILIVWDYCKHAGDLMEEKFGTRVVSNGRGSGAGSVVLYSLEITGIDPLKYGLLFERFLNPERVSMPDVDTDFSQTIRPQMFKYVEEKYGHVSRISTITIAQSKGALRTACSIIEHILKNEDFNNPTFFPLEKEDLEKIENSSYDRPLLKLGDFLSKAYDESLEEINKEEKRKDIKPFELTQSSLGSAYANFGEEVVNLAIKYASELEGSPTALGIHAAGCIISDKPVTEYAPIRVTEDKETKEPLTAIEADMIQAEGDFGLIKMDFLGLVTLDVLAETIRQIKINTGHEIKLEDIPIDDQIVYEEIFTKANTAGVFQFESDFMKDILRRFKPSKFEDIVLINAVGRPGPLQFIDGIIDVKEGRASPSYITDNIKPVLEMTYGFPVYQEQLMQIFNIGAGFTLGQADSIRRAMSKKKIEKFAAYKDDFINGLIKSGAEKTKAEDFWEQLLKFAEYA